MVSPSAVRLGGKVLVPWGAHRDVPARIVEVWGDPAEYIRVKLQFDEADPEDDPVVLLVRPSWVQPA